MTIAWTIRGASSEDFAEIRRLFLECRLDVPSELPMEPADHVHLIVLDAPEGGLAGAALLILEPHKGQVALLAVDLRYQGLGIEERLIGVSEALSEALGVHNFEVASVCLRHY
ncbi:MAG: hypothetical protein SFX73_12640 [Kofleriaceae bacterium]|nr:hypothetical protein [Kofleriaceae bacterium]